MKKILSIIYLFCNTLIFAKFYLLNDDLSQGDVLVSYKKDEGFSKVTGYIKVEDKTYTASPSFKVNIGNIKVWVLALGISPLFDYKNEYNLIIESISKDNKKTIESKKIKIKQGHFKEFTLKLNKSITSLVFKPSKRKAEESKELSKIIMSFNNNYTNRKQIFFKEPLNYVYYTSGFGEKRTYIYSNKTKQSSIHKGLDYRGSVGTPVFAPADSKVVLAKKRELTGGSVVIEHFPGIFSLFYHLSKISVKVGQKIKKGDEIGKVGSTGFATGPHLHWEMRVRGQAVNPKFFLKNNILDRRKIIDILKKGEQNKVKK